MISLYEGRTSFQCSLACTHNTSAIGAAIMIMSLVLFENEFLYIISISFTALILNELITVVLEITTWYVSTLLLWKAILIFIRLMVFAGIEVACCVPLSITYW